MKTKKIKKKKTNSLTIHAPWNLNAIIRGLIFRSTHTRN